MSDDKKTGLMKLEDTFSNTLKPGEKFLCMKQKTAVITMCSLLIFSCVYHFGINVGARWGKPCFIWWEHWATIVTFVIGCAARLAVLPLASLALLDTKKPVGETKFLRPLFHALLALAVLQMLDVVLCIFEVNEVCTSASMASFSDCAYERSRYAAGAPIDQKLVQLDPTQPIFCPPACVSDAAGVPTMICPTTIRPGDGAGVIETSLCASNPAAGVQTYDWSEFVCSAKAATRATTFRPHRSAPDAASSCELMSTLYDIGLGLVGVVITVAFAWSINSYRQTEEESSG